MTGRTWAMNRAGAIPKKIWSHIHGVCISTLRSVRVTAAGRHKPNWEPEGLAHPMVGKDLSEAR